MRNLRHAALPDGRNQRVTALRLEAIHAMKGTTTTQDDFVRFLIAGPDEEFKAKIEEAQRDNDS